MNFKNIIRVLLLFCLTIALSVILSIPSCKYMNTLYFLLLAIFLIFFVSNLLYLLRFLKKDAEIVKKEFKKYYLNIYWKKTLLFCLFFSGKDILLQFLHGANVKMVSMGFPLTYYFHSYDYAVFSPTMFIFGIILWWMIAGLIIKEPEKVARKTTILNYFVLFITLYYLFKSLDNILGGITNMKYIGFI